MNNYTLHLTGTEIKLINDLLKDYQSKLIADKNYLYTLVAKGNKDLQPKLYEYFLLDKTTDTLIEKIHRTITEKE